MRLRPRGVRAPFSVTYRLLYHGVTLATGIDLPYSTKLGRRVRFWHHGGTVISARAVGDDVHIRHNTTVGVARRGAPVDQLPVIGNRVDIGVGAAILGPIVIADDTVIGGNAVVVRSNRRQGETLVGVPARSLEELGRRATEA
jgi:serine O-acetyltransferase